MSTIIERARQMNSLDYSVIENQGRYIYEWKNGNDIISTREEEYISDRLLYLQGNINNRCLRLRHSMNIDNVMNLINDIKSFFYYIEAERSIYEYIVYKLLNKYSDQSDEYNVSLEEDNGDILNDTEECHECHEDKSDVIVEAYDNDDWSL